MPELERNAYPARGPSFFRTGDAVMFQFVMDPTNILGPRVATKADSLKHPEAWSEFMRGEQPAAELIDAREAEPPAEPRTAVEPKGMDEFAARLEPASDAPKRKYTRREAVTP